VRSLRIPLRSLCRSHGSPETGVAEVVELEGSPGACHLSRECSRVENCHGHRSPAAPLLRPSTLVTSGALWPSCIPRWSGRMAGKAVGLRGSKGYGTIGGDSGPRSTHTSSREPSRREPMGGLAMVAGSWLGGAHRVGCRAPPGPAPGVCCRRGTRCCASGLISLWPDSCSARPWQGGHRAPKQPSPANAGDKREGSQAPPVATSRWRAVERRFHQVVCGWLACR
jgi:hypothetical protein